MAGLCEAIEVGRGPDVVTDMNQSDEVVRRTDRAALTLGRPA
jgi:hypothetical protein